MIDDRFQTLIFKTNELACHKVFLQVGIIQSKVFKLKMRPAILSFADWVGFSYQVTLFPVSLNELINPKFLIQRSCICP